MVCSHVDHMRGGKPILRPAPFLLLLSVVLLGSLVVVFTSENGAGLTFSTTESGNWNHAAVWGGAGVPGATHTAIINPGHEVSLVVDESVKNLYVGGTLYTDSFNFETLRDCVVNGSFVANSSALIQHQYLDINGGTYSHQSGQISITNIDGNGYALDNDGTMMTTSDIVISSWQDANIFVDFSGLGETWNVEYSGNKSLVLLGQDGQHFNGNLTIGQNATAYLSQPSWSITVDGTFDVFGQWGHGSLEGAHNIGALTVNDGATYYASQGENRISTSLRINETASFHHENSFINSTGSLVNFYPGGHSFYDLLIWDSSLNIRENITIEHWVNYSSQLPDKPWWRIGDPELHLWNNLTFTLGTESSSGYVWSGSDQDEFYLHGPGEFLIRGASEEYFGNIRGNEFNYASMPIVGLQWINWVTEDNGARTNLVEDAQKYILYGNSSCYATLGLNNVGCTLDLNGFTWSVSYGGVTMESGTILIGPGNLTLGTGGTSDIQSNLNITHITSNGNDIQIWTNASVIVEDIEYLKDQDRNGNPTQLILKDGATLEFTTTTGLVANNTILDVDGTFDNMAAITGPPDWHLDVDQLNDWMVIFANISNCNNVGSQPFTYLGVNWTGNTNVDTVAPVIESSLAEGYAWDRTNTHDFLINITVSDMSFVFDVFYEIYASNGTLMAQGSTDWTEFGELHQVLWNTSNVSMASWMPGDYTILITTNDSHNPAKTKVAKERAQNMVCDIDGEEIGSKKDLKESKEKPGKSIKFKQFEGSDIFTLDFMADKADTKHDVKWRIRENNFKLGFMVKLKNGEDRVQLTISSERITYLPNSNYHGHFIIGPTRSYFFDLEDFHLDGGLIEVSKKQIDGGNESYTITLTHPSWGKGGGWVYIDPLAGSVNTGTLEINWTLVITPTIVSPANNSNVKNQNWANLIVSVGDIGNITANITFYDASDDSVIGTGSTVGDGTLQVNWTGLAWNHVDYSWYSTCEILGYNGSSSIQYFSTSTRSSSTTIDPPSGGGGGGGSSGGGSASEPTPDQSSNTLIITIMGALIITIIGVWAFFEYFEEGLSK